MAGAMKAWIPSRTRWALRRATGRASDEELALSSLVQQGDITLDIGANRGEFSVLMSLLVGKQGRVHAFEPNPEMVEMLREALRARRATNVVVVGAAASDRTGVVTLHVDRRPGALAAASTILPSPARWGPTEPIEVPCVTLDDYCAEQQIRPAFIKIDVEGAEALVLEGYRLGLRSHRPKLLIEVGTHDPEEVAIAMLRGFDYHLTDVAGGIEWKRQPIPPPYVPWVTNVLAVPR